MGTEEDSWCGVCRVHLSVSPYPGTLPPITWTAAAAAAAAPAPDHLLTFHFLLRSLQSIPEVLSMFQASMSSQTAGRVWLIPALGVPVAMISE